MEFLADRHERTIYNYKSAPDSDGNVATVSGTPAELAEYFGKEPLFEPKEVMLHGTEEYTYAGFDTLPMSVSTKVVYEQHGRKAIRVTTPAGGVQYRSMSKENILESGKQDPITKSVLTKACREAYHKAHKEKENKILRQYNKFVGRQ